MHGTTSAGLAQADQPAGSGQHQDAGEAGHGDSGDLANTGSTKIIGVPGAELRSRDHRVVSSEGPIGRLRPAQRQVAGTTDGSCQTRIRLCTKRRRHLDRHSERVHRRRGVGPDRQWDGSNRRERRGRRGQHVRRLRDSKSRQCGDGTDGHPNDRGQQICQRRYRNGRRIDSGGDGLTDRLNSRGAIRPPGGTHRAAGHRRRQCRSSGNVVGFARLRAARSAGNARRRAGRRIRGSVDSRETRPAAAVAELGDKLLADRRRGSDTGQGASSGRDRVGGQPTEGLGQTADRRQARARTARAAAARISRCSRCKGDGIVRSRIGHSGTNYRGCDQPGHRRNP